MRGFDVPPWLGGYVSGARPPGVPQSQMRIGDADRNEVAEALSKHFADGRLDQSEFDERMARAMSAKTRADLAGLLDDLPPAGGPVAAGGAPVSGSRPERNRSQLMLIVAAVAVFMLVTSSWMWSWWHPRGVGILVVIAVVALVFRHRHNHHHHVYGGQRPGFYGGPRPGPGPGPWQQAPGTWQQAPPPQGPDQSW